MSAHTPAMHLTVWLEVATGTLVLIGVAWLLFERLREPSPGA